MGLEEVTREFLAHPARWPNHPILPLKRYRVKFQMPDTACLWEDGDKLKIAIDANLFALIGGPDAFATHEWREVSIDEILAEGWMVD